MKDLRWLLDTPVAHRGYHGPGIPENSGAAFREAIKNGYPIELDIRMTKDNVFVVFHDDNLFRLTSYNKKIGDCTYAEIRKLVLDSTNERIPSFTDVLDYVNGRVGLLVEIKQHPSPGSGEEHLSRILDRYSGKFAVASFDPHILRWFLRNRPSYIRCQIVGGPQGKKLSVLQRFLPKDLVVALVCRSDIIAYEYRYLNSRIRLFADIFRIPVIVWTVREAETAKKLRETGQNFIFEGFPGNKI